MVGKSFEDLDDLFAKVRLGLAKVRQSDPATADELKSLLSQIEFWVESLVVDSLKLKGLEGVKQGTEGLSQGRPKRAGRE